MPTGVFDPQTVKEVALKKSIWAIIGLALASPVLVERAHAEDGDFISVEGSVGVTSGYSDTEFINYITSSEQPSAELDLTVNFGPHFYANAWYHHAFEREVDTIDREFDATFCGVAPFGEQSSFELCIATWQYRGTADFGPFGIHEVKLEDDVVHGTLYLGDFTVRVTRLEGSSGEFDNDPDTDVVYIPRLAYEFHLTENLSVLPSYARIETYDAHNFAIDATYTTDRFQGTVSVAPSVGKDEGVGFNLQGLVRFGGD